MGSSLALAAYTSATTGYPVAYTQDGEGDILLLVHGSLCDYRYWRWQIPAIGKHYRVVAPSLRGYWPQAFSRDDPSFSVAQHVRDLITFIREIGEGRPVHILGHSRGAQIALEAVTQAPELAQSLMLADPGFCIKGEAAAPSFHTEVVALLQQGDTETALARFIDTVNGPGTWRQMVGWFKTMVKENAYTLLSQVREADLAVDLEQAAAVACPVLLLGGAQSPPRYGSRLDTLQTIWPHARRVTIPMAAHGMNLANPAAFNRAVLDFLSAIRA